MKITTNIIFIALTLFFTSQGFAQQSNSVITDKTVSPKDTETILGDWTGSLTYIDYSSNKPYTMPADVTVKQGKNKNKLSLNFKYPNEPNANSQGQILISKKGDKINNEIVVSKRVLSNNQLEITTEYIGKDNNKKAVIRNTYILGSKQFVIRKNVKFENSNEWIMRNEYSFDR
ncbi:MAG: hypothetical protein BM564_01165 [Bacteroidetes bacterium MedPE-SWsnd-G2]|mgnify:CR=1 FL=1|nr:MAG: hypothetical protein BM564_01165 [Bacteroidetes bacterium MedPE-SWsnd-G2]